MKKNKLVKISIIFTILLYIILSGINTSFAGTISSDINGINDSKYPGIKSLIQNLQKKYNNYNFQVYYTGIDWTEAVTMEYQGHGGSPKNLFSASSKYQGKWYCPICGSKTYDTGWYCASVDAIKYMMDPRNSLDETSVFQFKNLEVADVTPENIQKVINSKYSSYSYINNQIAIDSIVKSSTQCNLNGYSILAKIINEQGKGTSPFATGSGYNGYGIGYYNFFNVGAYGNGNDNVMKNGLTYAINKGWNSVESSILGGSEYYKSQYIGRGQNTLYYQRFNVIYTPSLFSHQYQQDIMGAQTSATLLKSYYTTSETINNVNHTFIIPLYENMPVTVCSRPSTTENSKLEYEDAIVLNNKLAVKAAPNSSRTISYLNKNEKIKVLQMANSKSSDGNYWDIIVSNTDGTYGYVLRSGIELVMKNNYPSFIFDYKYYADTNSDLKAAFGYDELKLYRHFITSGIKEGRSSSPVFNAKYYIENNKDLKIAFGTNYIAACDHFMNCGYNEYRKCSPEFDISFYKYFYKDLTNLDSLQLIQHYISCGKSEGRLGKLDDSIESIVFDATVYSECNLDLKAVFGNNEKLLRNHWLSFGIKEGRMSSLMYSGETYRLLNDDLQKAFGNNYTKLFLHFVNNGINECRPTSIFFDVPSYLTLNPDIKDAYQKNYKQSYIHFNNCGIKEGRQACNIFEVRTYINLNPDLKVAYGSDYKRAFIHFIQSGIKESRKTSSRFDINYYKENNKDLQIAFGNNLKEYYLHYLRCGRFEGRRGI